MLRKLLGFTAVAFVCAMVVNTIIALFYRWPAMFDAPGNPQTIATDFVLHGTRISPPMHALLILIVAAVFAQRSGWRGVTGSLVLAGFSILCAVAAAGEPAALPPNEIPKLVWLLLGAIGRYAPILMIGLAVGELFRRGLTRKRSELRRCLLALENSFRCDEPSAASKIADASKPCAGPVTRLSTR